MKVLLVDSPFHAFMNYDRWHFPTSLAQLAAVAHEQGHEVHVYDADRYHPKDPATRNRNELIRRQHQYFDNVDNFDHPIWRHLKKTLADIKPDVVGVSVFTCKLKTALNVLKLARECDPKVRTCVGGAHVTALPDSFASNKDVDGVFVGYADATFPQWLKDGCPQGTMRGDMAGIDFETLPYPRRRALLFREHFTPRDVGFVFTSRGCVARCTFCSNSFLWSGKPRFRPSDVVRAEMRELIEEWKIDSFLLGDSSNSDFHEENKRVASVLKEFGLPWSSNVRWATVTRELLEHFMDCGCTGISVGLEAGSDKILKSMRKGCTKKTIREKARMINSLGLGFQLFTIIGFPDETEDEMSETRDFALEIDPTSVSLNSLSPLPGTEVFNGMPGMSAERASTVNQLHPDQCFSKHMDLERFVEIFSKITMSFEEHNASKRAGRGASSQK
ncbi:B12-binding domain-containing radical SAM protein [Elusimicrobiota bacterium]